MVEMELAAPSSWPSPHSRGAAFSSHLSADFLSACDRITAAQPSDDGGEMWSGHRKPHDASQSSAPAPFQLPSHDPGSDASGRRYEGRSELCDVLRRVQYQTTSATAVPRHDSVDLWEEAHGARLPRR